MSAFKSLFATAVLLVSPLAFAQFTDVINSNRPGKSMAAFSVGKTVIQAELGAFMFKEEHELTNYQASGFGGELAVRYGAFFEQLEFIAELQYQNENYTQVFIDQNHSGLKLATVGAKFLLYDPVKNYEQKPNLYSWNANHKFSWRQFIPAVGIYGGVNFHMSNDIFRRPLIPLEKKMSLRGMVLTQNQFGRFVFVTNIIVDKFPSNKSIDYVITLTHGFNSRWSGFIEGQGYNGDYYSDVIFRGGAAFLVYENIQVDASIGTNLKNTPTIVNGGIGVSWRFDANYEDVYLRIPGEKKSKEEKTKDKKKEKNKKRLDAIENGEKVKE
jgi:outer membrane putative beta-barrel porin/alpha-amylase